MTGPRRFDGTGIAPGRGVGSARRLRPTPDLDPPPIDGVDPDRERCRFESAVDDARCQLRRIGRTTSAAVGETSVVDAQLGFLASDSLRSNVAAAIDDGLPAEHAVKTVLDERAADFDGLDGPASRATLDLLDLRDRLVGILADPAPVEVDSLPEETVLVAERLRPTEIAAVSSETLAGIVAETRVDDTHAAVVARSLGVPTVADVGPGVRTIDEEDRLAVDGSRGQVIVGADDPTLRSELPTGSEIDGSDAPSTVRPSGLVAVDAALESADAASELRDATGVGLFRSEGLFFGRQSPPSEDEQYTAYGRLFEAVAGPVVVRTLDVGLDKVPPAFADRIPTDRPLGRRGIRLSLGPLRDEFESQLRAIQRAAVETENEVTVLFPMVTVPTEVDRAKAVAEACADAHDGDTPVEFGAMVETPAAAMHADDLADRVSLLSIGSSDLTQYVQAAGRNDDSVADLYDPLTPAVLRVVDEVVSRTGDDARVTICGDAVAEPRAAPLFAGIGVDAVVPTPAALAETRRVLEGVDSDTAKLIASRTLGATDAEAVRGLLSECSPE